VGVLPVLSIQFNIATVCGSIIASNFSVLFIGPLYSKKNT